MFYINQDLSPNVLGIFSMRGAINI